jgi:aminoglycoside phosphotransferase (APT) family kinase protein
VNTVINVRSELLDDLLAVLRRATGRAELDFDDTPTLLTGGFWAQLVSFRLTGAPAGWDVPLVARVMPEPATAAKETAFQRAIAAQGYPTPRVVEAGGPDPGIAGQAYMVMDLAEGQPLLSGLDGISALTRLPSLARRLPRTLAAVLADLHGLDPGRVMDELDASGVPHPTLPATLAHLRETAAAFERPDLITAADWLAAHQPTEEPAVLCHGDMHPFNVLVDESGGVTVLDWSAALLAPATYDLAFTSLLLAEPPLVAPGPLQHVVQRAGRALSNRFLRAYENVRGATVDSEALAWHQGLICVRALVEVAGWVAADTIDDRGGHPWVIAGDAFAARLSTLTGHTASAR